MALTNAVLAVTEQCNSRCCMCNIWRGKRSKQKELSSKDFAKLPHTLKEINVSGGEPFLRKDLVEIIQNIKRVCPNAKIVFSTNGFLTKKIAKDMKEILELYPTVAVRVSIDGLQKTHDKIRGVKGAFKKATATLRALKKIGVRDLGIGFTAQKTNLKEIFSVYQLAQRNGWDYSFVLAQSSDFYFKKKNPQLKNQKRLKEQLQKVIQSQLQSLNPRNLFRAWYENACIEFAETCKRPVQCSAARASCFIDAQGKVWACNVHKERLGKLGGKIETKKAKEKLKDCSACWMLCSTMPIREKDFLKIGKEILLLKMSNLK